MRNEIPETGIFTVHEPENCAPIADIIIVHGLQGHPFKTWACTNTPKEAISKSSAINGSKRHSRAASKGWLRRIIPRLSKNSPTNLKPVAGDQSSPKDEEREGGVDCADAVVFWPADLLPRVCPHSRILMYGYDTKVTKYMLGAPNKSSVFSHGKDLLYALARERTLNRPLILIAHSLGGIVVKEMLAGSAQSVEKELRNIVESTTAVIFLGTPHRGSPDLAALGEWLRVLVSTFRMDTSSAILDALGLRTTDLERAQETFSRLWYRHGFRVKTFQEGLGLTGINLGVLGNKVVPDYSSAIGDSRERAETLQANHMDMCRFWGADDPNYRKVSGEIAAVYETIAAPDSYQPSKGAGFPSDTTCMEAICRAQASRLDGAEHLALQSLLFPSMNARRQLLGRPAENTARWLFEHETYQGWFSGRSREQTHGLLWLKGKPGSGKSTLMNEAFSQAVLGQGGSNYGTAAFFFNARGDDLEHSPLGLFRSVLHQLLPGYRDCLRLFTDTWLERQEAIRVARQRNVIIWKEAELRALFQAAFTQPGTRRTLIYIDALDECDSEAIRSQAYFWRETTRLAYTSGVHLDVCLSSRHFPSITIADCSEIVVENHNGPDIARYVEQKFSVGIAAKEPQWQLLRDRILYKSVGVFLWTALVTDTILRSWDDGKSLKYLLKQLDVVPEALEALFSQMFESIKPEARQLTARFFQWAILTAKPLRLHEWHHVLGFIRTPVASSLCQWRMSDDFTVDDDQLERQIRNISMGLVEVRNKMDGLQDTVVELMSLRGGAGSLDQDRGETRVVQVVHESVREFFLQKDGFSRLDPSLTLCPTGNSHISIMLSCLDYLNISELDDLVDARGRAGCRVGDNLATNKELPARGARNHSSPEPRGRTRYTAGAREERELSLPGVPVVRSQHSAKVVSPTFEGYDDNYWDSFTGHTSSSHIQDKRAVETSRKRHSSVESFGSASSHRPAQLDYATDMDYYHHGQLRRRSPSPIVRIKKGPIPREEPVLELLRKRSDSGPYSAVDQWIETYQPVIDHVALGRSPSCSTTDLSVTQRSQILEDYPALLSYALFELFTHARLAQDEGSDPSPVIKRLQQQWAWNRWVAMREDLLPNTELLYYAADQQLFSWVANISKNPGSHFRDSVTQALREGNKRALRVLIHHGAIQRPRESINGESILHILARISDPSLLHEYLDHIGELPHRRDSLPKSSSLLDQRDSLERTPLHIAVARQDAAVSEILLRHGADVNATDSYGRSPLHIACHYTSTRPPEKAGNSAIAGSSSSVVCETLRVLIAHGADVSARDKVGATPLHQACWRGFRQDEKSESTAGIVKLLLKSGADVNARDNRDETPMHIATAMPDREVFVELVKRGANTNAVDLTGRTPLDFAACWGNKDMVYELLSGLLDTEDNLVTEAL